MARIVGEAGVKVVPDAEGFEDDASAQIGPGLDGMTSESGVIGSFTKKVAGMIAAAFAVNAAKDFAVDSLLSFGEFEQGMNEVFTLLPGQSQASFDALTQQSKDFAGEFGVLPDQVVPALYQSLSAGVPQDNVFDFLGTAQQAAMGGVTDLTTAVDGISSVVNAYGEDVVGATDASDLMFTAVRLGKTNFEELSSSLFNVTPIASGLGVQFSDVTAALATMTAQGTPTSVATTQMRQLFIELSKEGGAAAEVFENIAGQSFQQFVEGGGNVNEALDLMQQAADDSGKQIQDMFGSAEAGAAALSLTGSDAFAQNIDAMGDSAGATEAAFEQMDQGTARAMERIRVQFELAKIKVGEFLAPLIEGAIAWVTEHGPAIADSVGTVIGVVGDMGAEVVDVIGEAVDIVADLVGWFQDNEAATRALAGGVAVLAAGFVAWKVAQLGAAAATQIAAAAQWLWNAAMNANPIGVAIIAIAALTAGIIYAYEESETFRDILDAVWDAIQVGVDFLLNNVVPAVERFAQDVGAYFMAVWEVVENVIGLVINIFQGDWAGAWDSAKAVVSGVVDAVIAYFHAIPQRLLNLAGDIVAALATLVTDHLWPAFVDGVSDLIDAAIDFFIDLPGRVLDVGSDLGNKAGDLVADHLWPAIVDGVEGVIDAAMDFVKGLPGRVIDVGTDLGNKAGDLVADHLWPAVVDGFSDVVQAALDFVIALPGRVLGVGSNLATKAGQLVTDHAWPALVGGFSDMVQAAYDFVKGLPDRLVNLGFQFFAKAWGLGQDIKDGLFAGLGALGQALVDMLNAAWDALVDAFNKLNPINLLDKIPGSGIVKDIVGFFGGGGGGNPDWSPVPPPPPPPPTTSPFRNRYDRAEGGPVDAGIATLVGERGPEIFFPDSAGRIVPNNQLGGVTFERGSIVVNLANGDDRAARRAGNQVGDAAARRIEQRRRMTLARAAGTPA